MHMATPIGKSWAPAISPIKSTVKYGRAVAREVEMVPRNKATGLDEVFVDAFDIDSTTTSKIICALWSHCSRLKQFIEDWTTAILIPLYERGDKSQAQSYSPIALSSHVRKVVEAAIARQIRENIDLTMQNLGSAVKQGPKRQY